MTEVADPLFNGARLWQLSELFPQAAFAEGEGMIGTSSVEDRVYLTTNWEVALAYGAIPGWQSVERYRQGEPMEFLPAGVVLSLDSGSVVTRQLGADELTAKVPDPELNHQVCVTWGPLPISEVTGIEIIFFDRIAGDPTVRLVDADLKPIANRTPRDLWFLKRKLGMAAHAIQTHHGVPVETLEIGLTGDELITLFERT